MSFKTLRFSVGAESLAHILPLNKMSAIIHYIDIHLWMKYNCTLQNIVQKKINCLVSDSLKSSLILCLPL